MKTKHLCTSKIVFIGKRIVSKEYRVERGGYHKIKLYLSNVIMPKNLIMNRRTGKTARISFEDRGELNLIYLGCKRFSCRKDDWIVVPNMAPFLKHDNKGGIKI